ncbi:MAG: hypothetical protein CBD47_00030 [Synechococcus sp. TMED187]|nr:MAG: hypothetical protein CBD47_00030 [Synechococcus sp. TMED187]
MESLGLLVLLGLSLPAWAHLKASFISWLALLCWDFPVLAIFVMWMVSSLFLLYPSNRSFHSIAGE